MDDKAVRELLRTGMQQQRVPPARLDDVLRRTARRKTRRRLAGVAVSLVILAGVALPLVFLGSLTGSPRDGDPASGPQGESRSLSIGGLKVSVSPGWHGHVYMLEGYTRPVVRLATFGLPADDDIRATTARSLMGDEDVLIGITEYSAVCPCPGFAPTTAPLSLDAADFVRPYDVWNALPPQAIDIPARHSFARKTFAINRRFLDLWVEFGEGEPSPEALSQVDAILASLRVGDFTVPSQPDGVCNEWSLQKDPDCPQTMWLKAVLAAAGFEVIDSEQESTLIGKGGGAKFFIWAREPLEPLEDSRLRHYSTIAGIDVYGGGHLVWRAQDRNVWVAPGPYGSDQRPGREGLRALIDATLTVPYPREP